MKRIILFAIFFASAIAISVAQSTETRSLSEFTKITVGEAIDLILVPGNKNEAIIKSSKFDLEDVLLDIRGNTLKVELAGTRHNNIDVEITLTYKQIDALSINSAADVRTRGTIKSSSLDISVATAGNANLEILVDKVDINISSAGELELNGATTSQNVDVSSAGTYHGYNLACAESYVRVSSAGTARVTASKKIDARANSAGSIKYKGDPEKVYLNSNSGGSAKKST